MWSGTPTISAWTGCTPARARREMLTPENRKLVGPLADDRRNLPGFGTETGKAIADVLFGDYNPSGNLDSSPASAAVQAT
ncbi:MAG TPA: hypothetical protein VG077_13910 [Verrucomicrobiae bacterium]|nr:hypothetical protein [Verrucomicrobiae bacterium]